MYSRRGVSIVGSLRGETTRQPSGARNGHTDLVVFIQGFEPFQVDTLITVAIIPEGRMGVPELSHDVLVRAILSRW